MAAKRNEMASSSTLRRRRLGGICQVCSSFPHNHIHKLNHKLSRNRNHTGRSQGMLRIRATCRNFLPLVSR